MNRREVREAWEAIATTYADRRDADGSDAALVAELATSFPSEATVLDVGCGDGARTLANLPQDSVGLDLSREGLALARQNVPEARLLQGDMTALPVADSTVDCITAYHAVFHVHRNDHPTVYREFARVLRPGGTLLMTLPSGRFHSVRDGWMGGRMLFSAPGPERTRSQLADAGFEDLRTETVSDPLGSTATFVFADREASPQSGNSES
jgi:SAM-dependent methyltransferase